jgi:hypothetical protein
MSKNVGASTSRKGLNNLYRDNFTLVYKEGISKNDGNLYFLKYEMRLLYNSTSHASVTLMPSSTELDTEQRVSTICKYYCRFSECLHWLIYDSS